MATIKDIALRAGVTPTTVSNVLHHRTKRVSAETVTRVQEIIREMGYVPNMSARSLVGSSSRIIGVISSLVSLSAGGFFQDPFHAVLLGGIEQEARKRGYFLMVRSVENAEELQNLLTNWSIDGLIMTGSFPLAFYRQLEESGKPYAQVDNILRSSGLKVLLEDEKGGYLATKYLIGHGHREILFCCPPLSGSPVIMERYSGFCRALRENGIMPREQNVYETEFARAEDGIALGKRLAERKDFTAIFSTADILAAELCTGLMQAGRKIPEEISIVGFDDTSIGRINCPPLTTIRQDVAARGQKAVQMLVDALEKGVTAEPYIFPVSLIERESVRKI